MNLELLKAIYKRHKKYGGKVFISRYEFERFGLTEWGMRKAIRELRKAGLQLVGKKFVEVGIRFSNVYKISNELLELIKTKLGEAKFNIAKFNKEVTLDKAKELLGIQGFGKNFVISKTSDYKYTYNSDYNIITRWGKRGEQDIRFNFFNGLKELFGLSSGTLIHDLLF